MRIRSWAVVGTLAVLVTLLWPAAAAQAATGTYLRLAHLSPDTPTVDVLVTSFGRPDWSLRLDGVDYGDVSPYQRVDPGTYTVQMRPPGAAPSTPPVVSGTLVADERGAYTVAGLGMRADLAVQVLADDLTLPPPDQARMRVVQAADSAGELEVRRAGAPMTERVGFGSATGYVTVPAGLSSLEVVPTGVGPIPLQARLTPGGVYSVLVLQRDGRLVAEVRADAQGTGRAPVGGVETGMGGTAAGPGPDTGPPAAWPAAEQPAWWLAAGLAAGLVGVAAGLLFVRRSVR